MKASALAEDIAGSVYSIQAFVSQVFGAVAYMKWIQPFEAVLKYTGPDELDHLSFYLLNIVAFAALSYVATRPFAMLAAEIVREIDNLVRRNDTQ